MTEKRLTACLITGLALFSSLWFPLGLSAQVGCNGRCLFINDEPKCSLSLFGANICYHGQDYCAEFACQGSTMPTEPGSPAETAGIALNTAESMEPSRSVHAPEEAAAPPPVGPLRGQVLRDRS